MNELFKNILEEERDREEAQERATNNGQLSAAAQAAHASADRSEATTRQMQGYSSAAGGLGYRQEGPSGPFLGRWEITPDMNIPSGNVSGRLNWTMQQQQGSGASGYSGNQQGNAQQQAYPAQGYATQQQPYSAQGNATQQQPYSAQGNATQQQPYSAQDYATQQRRRGY